MSKPYESREEQRRYPATTPGDIALNFTISGVALVAVVSFVLNLIIGA